jgi:hypothetical protein
VAGFVFQKPPSNPACTAIVAFETSKLPRFQPGCLKPGVSQEDA